jgi:hypothetical protein
MRSPQEILAVLAELAADITALPFIEQDRILRILSQGLSKIQPEPVGSGENPAHVSKWMTAPDTWERWSKW